MILLCVELMETSLISWQSKHFSFGASTHFLVERGKKKQNREISGFVYTPEHQTVFSIITLNLCYIQPMLCCVFM